MSINEGERGAAAVELAIILPLLLVLVGGIIDFGRLLYAEVMVTNAAREGVRMLAMGYPPADATIRIQSASPGLAAAGGLAAPVYSVCSAPGVGNASATVSIAAFDWLLVDAFVSLAAPQPSSTATMRCGG